jgi:pheromone shutdown protein TraB
MGLFCRSFLLATGLLLGLWNLDSCAGISTYDTNSPFSSAVLSASCLTPTDVTAKGSSSARFSADGLINTTDKSLILSTSGELVETSQPTGTDHAIEVITSTAVSSPIDPDIYGMMQKYKGRFLYCSLPQYPTVDILLCGTLHVAQTSANMAEDAMKVLRPSHVVLELCQERVENLYDQGMIDITLSDIVKGSYRVRSLKVLVMGLLTWMQLKAAKALGSTLGEEQILAAKIGDELGSDVILGDRLYSVTIQRIFDTVKFFEKIKFAIVFIWEILTMNLNKLKDYIKLSENQDGFIQDEITRFRKHLPKLATVLIDERDEFLAQTISDTVKEISISELRKPPTQKRARVMAVVGAGHLAGMQRCLGAGGASDERLIEISCSSKHPYPGMWIGRGNIMKLLPRRLWQELPLDADAGAGALLVSEPHSQPQQQQQQQQHHQQHEIVYQAGHDSAISGIGAALLDASEVSQRGLGTLDQHQNQQQQQQQQLSSETLSQSAAPSMVGEEYREVSDVFEMESDLDEEEYFVSSDAISEVEEVGSVVEEEVREVEEHEAAVVQLMATLIPVVKRAYTAMSVAQSTAGVVLSHELLTHFALFEEAFKDAKKAFDLTDALEGGVTGSADMERNLYGVSNAVIRAEVAAKAVIEEAEMLVANINK